MTKHANDARAAWSPICARRQVTTDPLPRCTIAAVIITDLTQPPTLGDPASLIVGTTTTDSRSAEDACRASGPAKSLVAQNDFKIRNIRGAGMDAD